MLLKGKAISPLVERLQSATLPAVLEYGCLRFAIGDAVPDLPKEIISAAQWGPLRAINSELGLSREGPRKSESKDVSPRSTEFTTVWDENDTMESAWENFLRRFEGSSKAAGFTSDAALNLQSALHEMATNAVIHSRSAIPTLIGYAVTGNRALFAVADVGQGIVASLTSNPKYAQLTQPVDAIHKALQTGVTCRVDDDGGFGFSTIFKAVAEAWGQLRFRSGNGCITMDGTGLNTDRSIRRFPPALPGFQVSVCCHAGSVMSPAF
jgi:hypothetical protein